MMDPDDDDQTDAREVRRGPPLGDGWRYEPKWDGFRAIVTRDAAGVRIDSRGDRPLGRYFPELVELLAAQPPATYVMDGEIVMIAGGVMDFETLQLRLHPAASRVNKLAGEIPATLVAFDLLELDGRDVRPLDTDERRTELEGLIERLGAELAPDSPGGLHPGPALILTPQTADVEQRSDGSPTWTASGRTASSRSAPSNATSRASG